MLNCSSSTCSSQRALFCTTAITSQGRQIWATNRMLSFDRWLVKAIIFLVGWQGAVTFQIPYRNYTLSLGARQQLPQALDQKQSTSWFSSHYLSKALGTVVISMMGEVKKGDTKIFLRTMYTVILVWKTESIHTTHCISPGQKC